jgi:hypothetical protein
MLVGVGGWALFRFVSGVRRYPLRLPPQLAALSYQMSFERERLSLSGTPLSFQIKRWNSYRDLISGSIFAGWRQKQRDRQS